MKAARSMPTGHSSSARRSDTRMCNTIKPNLPIHLHVENNRDLGIVFQATPERVREALSRHPRLAGKVRVTIGHDGDIYAHAMRTANVLFGWRFDREDLAEKAPRLVRFTLMVRALIICSH